MESNTINIIAIITTMNIIATITTTNIIASITTINRIAIITTINIIAICFVQDGEAPGPRRRIYTRSAHEHVVYT